MCKCGVNLVCLWCCRGLVVVYELCVFMALWIFGGVVLLEKIWPLYTIILAALLHTSSCWISCFLSWSSLMHFDCFQDCARILEHLSERSRPMADWISCGILNSLAVRRHLNTSESEKWRNDQHCSLVLCLSAHKLTFRDRKEPLEIPGNSVVAQSFNAVKLHTCGRSWAFVHSHRRIWGKGLRTVSPRC